VFLSYAHADEDAFGMVDPFKSLLTRMVYAKTGRRLRVFRDKEGLKWGDDWRDRLQKEVLGASVFIPLLSAHYLDSEMCRMEFNKFRLASQSLGVPQLLLPVLILNAPTIFNDSSHDELVKQAIALQYEPIETAVLSDPGSADWKRTMAHIADRFSEAYQSAESVLAEIEVSDATEDGADGEEDLDAPGIAELMDELSTGMQELTDSTLALRPAMEELGSVGTIPPPQGGDGNPKQFLVWSIRVADSFRDPAIKIEREGQRLFEATSRVNETINQLYQATADVPTLEETLRTSLAGLSVLDDVRDQMTDLLAKMKPVEAFSVPLRKALRPIRIGVTKVNDSIAIIDSWTQL